MSVSPEIDYFEAVSKSDLMRVVPVSYKHLTLPTTEAV